MMKEKQLIEDNQNKNKTYNEIKEILIKGESYSKIKDYSKERHRVITYYEVGKILFDAGKHYGEDIIGNFSKKLIIDVDKKFNKKKLFRIRQFYIVFKDQNVAQVARLSWSHYQELLPVKDETERNYYLNRCIDNNLSRNDLRKIKKDKEYERLSKKTKEKLKNNKEVSLIETIKDPILIENKYVKEEIKEYELKNLILENLDNFLSQLGEGYSYIANEYKIKLGDIYNYIDILLFNYINNCFAVVELKVTELKKEYISQTKFYMNYIDENIKEVNQNKTIGILIVKENNKYVLKYLYDKKITSIEYVLI